MKCQACEEGNHDECGMQTWCECDCAGPDAIGLPHPEDIVGHKTFDTGEICPKTGFPKLRHEPLTRAEGEALWAHAQKCHEDRVVRMPDEKSALNTMHDAYTRLKDMGWREAIYCPKDGLHFQAIEAGSTGVHDCAYWGEWPNGHWNVFDGDVWPAHPILFKLYPEDQVKEDARREEARKRFAEAVKRGEI